MKFQLFHPIVYCVLWECLVSYWRALRWNSCVTIYLYIMYVLEIMIQLGWFILPFHSEFLSPSTARLDSPVFAVFTWKVGFSNARLSGTFIKSSISQIGHEGEYVIKFKSRYTCIFSKFCLGHMYYVIMQMAKCSTRNICIHVYKSIQKSAYLCHNYILDMPTCFIFRSQRPHAQSLLEYTHQADQSLIESMFSTECHKNQAQGNVLKAVIHSKFHKNQIEM